jgi:hypothetical protein
VPTCQEIRRRFVECLLWVTSDKAQVGRNESALTLIADIPGAWISVAMGQKATSATNPDQAAQRTAGILQWR